MRHLTLNNGVAMPVLGFGTYQITDSCQCEACVIEAARLGYRLFDTAQAYGNEEAVGAGIKKCGVPREELFITTKLWFRRYEAEDARASALGAPSAYPTMRQASLLILFPSMASSPPSIRLKRTCFHSSRICAR